MDFHLFGFVRVLHSGFTFVVVCVSDGVNRSPAHSLICTAAREERRRLWRKWCVVAWWKRGNLFS